MLHSNQCFNDWVSKPQQVLDIRIKTSLHVLKRNARNVRATIWQKSSVIKSNITTSLHINTINGNQCFFVLASRIAHAYACVAVFHLNVIRIAPGYTAMHPHTRTRMLSCMLPETTHTAAKPTCSCVRLCMLLSETGSETSTPAPTSAPVPPSQWQLPLLLLLHAAP